MSITVLLADDHQIMRAGLRALLEKQDGIKVIAEAEDGRSAVALAKECFPNIVILDITMPDLNGIEAARQIKDQCPNTKILALSMHSDKRFIVEMLRAGALGYLQKDSAFEELEIAIRTVATGQTYLSPRMTGIVVNDYLSRIETWEKAPRSLLSAREREVVQLIAEGNSTKQIAADLRLSVKTVETYRQQLMEKLGLYSVAELTKYAIREGMTALED